MSLYLIDGNSLAYKAFYAIGELSTSEGVPTGAVYGFVRMLLKILERDPKYIAAVFDSATPTYRHREYAAYKESRPSTPHTLSAQLPVIKEVLEGFGIRCLQVEGYEADDVIATLVQRLKEKVPIFVFTPDKDMLQLIQENVWIISPKKGLTDILLFDSKRVREKFGVSPEQIPDFLALAGDASDNIPGVPGVGEKRARKLLERFVSAKNIIDNLSLIEDKKLQQMLKEHKEQIIFYRNLLTLCKDVPMDIELSQLLKEDAKEEKLFPLFSTLQFRSIMDQIKGRQECINLEEAPLSYILSHIMEERLISLQLFQGQVVVCTKRLFALLDAQDPTLRRVLEDESIKKVVFSLKEVAKLFPSIKGVFDTQLAAHLLLPGAPVQDIKDLYIRYVKKRPPIVNPSDLFSVFLNLELYPILSKAVEEECVKDSLHSLEMPLSYVLAKMEQRGIVIDKERLQSLRDVLLRRLEDVQAMIYKEAGCVFNINSPKQLSQILFERLRLPKKKKTKTGYCTAEQVLQQLSAHHPLPARIMEYREVQKMLANYVEALLRTVGEDGRVHTCISQVSTSTGRLSVSSPPLQTIPQKGEFAKALRAVFVPAPGYRFIACDYSQMELRVFAHLSGDKALCKAFEEGKDFHTECATQLFGNSNERVKAKIVNFGILYGMSPYGLAKELGTSTKEAEEVIKEYFKRFPAASSYIREVLEFVHKNGYVQTLFGRRRYIPHINSANASLREFAKRAAINTVVQGTAAEIMKYAMLKVQHLLEDGKAHLLLQIHDELLFEVEEESLPELEEKIKECMETVITLSVPLIVRTRTGLSLEEVG